MSRHRFVSSRLIVAVAAIICTAVHAASVAPVGAEHGMVVTAHQLATKVGVDVLKRGGNAVDAAVAVGYAMAVVYPAAGNLGGGGFMLFFVPPERRMDVILALNEFNGQVSNCHFTKHGCLAWRL